MCQIFFVFGMPAVVLINLGPLLATSLTDESEEAPSKYYTERILLRISESFRKDTKIRVSFLRRPAQFY